MGVVLLPRGAARLDRHHQQLQHAGRGRAQQFFKTPVVGRLRIGRAFRRMMVPNSHGRRQFDRMEHVAEIGTVDFAQPFSGTGSRARRRRARSGQIADGKARAFRQLLSESPAPSGARATAGPARDPPSSTRRSPGRRIGIGCSRIRCVIWHRGGNLPVGQLRTPLGALNRPPPTDLGPIVDLRSLPFMDRR